MTLTPAIREFLIRLEELLDANAWPGADRDRMTTTTGPDGALVVLPHRDPARPAIEIEVRDRAVVVRYPPEQVTFTSRDEATQFLEMLGDGRVGLVVARNGLWTTMRSYRDEQPIPFRRTRMPWPTLRPRTERIAFGFAE